MKSLKVLKINLKSKKIPDPLTDLFKANTLRIEHIQIENTETQPDGPAMIHRRLFGKSSL